ncbi:MAG: M48 family metalloprotease [Bacteroidales bacterium]|nr:M48 family metalloprotease [Bacteroidales bacterium]
MKVFGLVALMVLTTCARNPVTGKRQFVLMSEQQEIAMGVEYDPQIVASFGLYENAAVQAFIDQRGQEMGLISHRPKLEYHIRLLDSPVINAFAVPGGYIYLTRGILTHFNNEAELIGVLAHEMGHITARHTVSRQAKQTLGQLAVIGGMIASEEFRQYGEAAMAGMQLIFLKFSRDDEREADRLGVEYTAKIGYDASRFADFFKLLVRMNLDSEHAGIPTFMSTHPDPGDRYNTVKQDAEIWKDSLNQTSWKVNENSYLQMIDGMVYGEDPRQGYVEGNTFYHPELKFRFSFPAGWKIENSPMQVRMAPADGQALMIFTFAPGNSLQEAAQNSVAQLELTVLESNNTTVHGMPALALVSEQSSQNPNTGEVQTIRVRSYYIDDNNTYYVFHGVSPQATFTNHLNQFNSTMQGFARLTDPSKINVKPKRIQVKRVQQVGTLADAFRYYGVSQANMEEFAFLNNMELTDRVTTGTLIKVVAE